MILSTLCCLLNKTKHAGLKLDRKPKSTCTSKYHDCIEIYCLKNLLENANARDSLTNKENIACMKDCIDMQRAIEVVKRFATYLR